MIPFQRRYSFLFQSAPERGLRGIHNTEMQRGDAKGFQSAPERGLRGISPRISRSSRPRVVSIRPGARAPGNPPRAINGTYMVEFQSAPERGLRGICTLTPCERRYFMFQSAPERGLRGIRRKDV